MRTICIGIGIFLGICFVLLALWHVYWRIREYSLLKSTTYAKALQDWEMLRDWYDMKHPSHVVFPYSMLIDTNGVVAMEVELNLDNQGRLKLSSDLMPSEMIMAVDKTKTYLRVSEGELYGGK